MAVHGVEIGQIDADEGRRLDSFLPGAPTP